MIINVQTSPSIINVQTSLNGGQLITINLSLRITPADAVCSSSGCSSNANIGAAATSHARTVTARDMGTMTEVWCSPDNLARSERGGGSRALAVGAKQRGKDADSQATTDTQGSPTRGCDELQVTRTEEGSQDTAAGGDSQANIMPEEDSQMGTTAAASQEVSPLQRSSPSTPRRLSNTPTGLCVRLTPPPTTSSPQSPLLVLRRTAQVRKPRLDSCASASSPAVPRVASPVATATLGVSSAATVGGSRAASPADGPLDVGPTTAVPAESAGRGFAVARTACNLMQLLQDPIFCAHKNDQLCKDVSQNRRDALDLAGKLPLALKALAMGISPHELNIDPAQAGGLLGKFDAVVRGSSSPTASSMFSENRGSASSSVAGEEGIEVKGARSYRGNQTFQISRMRPGTPFQHLLLVARRKDPTDWTDMRQLDQLFWLGHVRRSDFDQAVAKRDVTGGTGNARIQTPPRRTDELTASVTIGSRRRSWFGDIVTWVPFHKLDKAWWDANVRNTT